jgi:hypothetical protein
MRRQVLKLGGLFLAGYATYQYTPFQYFPREFNFYNNPVAFSQERGN